MFRKTASRTVSESVTETPTAPDPWADPALVAMFLTVGGAIVQQRRTESYSKSTWYCSGCGETPLASSYDFQMRNEANGHANSCRAMPRPMRADAS